MNIKNRTKIVSFILKYVWEINPQFIINSIVSTLLNSLFPFLLVLLPMSVVDEISLHGIGKNLFFLICLLCISEGVFRFASQRLELTRNLYNEKLMLDVQENISVLCSKIDYKNLESSDFFDLQSNALFPILKQNSLIRLFTEVETSISCLIKGIGLITIISFLNNWIILLFVVTSLVYIWTHKKLAQVSVNFSTKLQPINRKFTYYINMITDYRRAKEIRVYDAEPLISQKVGEYNMDAYEKLSEMSYKNAKYSVIGKICSVTQKYISYIYAVNLAYLGTITLGQLTMFINAIYSLTESILTLITEWIEYHRECEYLSKFYDFVHYCHNNAETKKGNQKMPHKIEKIEFVDIWFQYPNSNTYVLKGLNLCLQRGKKYALVGSNGEGKTTLIKLLLRFFEPQKGQILINNIPINQIDIDEYRKQITAVFQDYFLINETIEDNIKLDKIMTEEEIDSLLEQVNLQYLKTKLNFGYKTRIGKGFDKTAVELSGGEKQRLAVARMISKKAEIYLMDEPTAALDAKAEIEFYEQINELAKNKEGFFLMVSHRLSCMIFCDQIIVLENGRVSQLGRHQDLLKEEGLYQKLWEAQKNMEVSA